MKELYKIVSEKQWEESLACGYVVGSSIDKKFIHLATEEQLERIREKFWKNQSCVVLKLESRKLRGRLAYETNPGGTNKYYHLYDGQIPLDAVVDVKRLYISK